MKEDKILCELMGVPIPEHSKYAKKLIRNNGLWKYKAVTIYMPEEDMFEFADSLWSGQCTITLCDYSSNIVIGKSIKNRHVFEIILGKQEK